MVLRECDADSRKKTRIEDLVHRFREISGHRRGAWVTCVTSTLAIPDEIKQTVTGDTKQDLLAGDERVKSRFIALVATAAAVAMVSAAPAIGQSIKAYRHNILD